MYACRCCELAVLVLDLELEMLDRPSVLYSCNSPGFGLASTVDTAFWRPSISPNITQFTLRFTTTNFTDTVGFRT